MQQDILLLLVTSLLHITASTVYHVMPDNHYHPINDNTYTLQHYLNNTNKYFTSNTQLHFLPGQYYLNNDLIIQGVNNFSLIGNRTNEVINTVINCTSPAGIVVVNSSNIFIANIVMNECGNDYTTILNDHLFENNVMELISLLFFQSKLINCTYLHLNKGPGGIKFINPLINTKLSKLITNYLVIWYHEHTSKTNHNFYINNMQFHNNIDIYSVQIKQFDTSSNISVIITNTNFTNLQALHIVCINYTGHGSTILNDCNFTNNVSYYDYYGYDNLYDEFEGQNIGPCDDSNDNSTNSTVHAYYQDCANTYTPNNIQFINCFFVNNDGSKELILIVQDSYSKTNSTTLIITISDCVFHNNQYARFLFVDSYNEDLNYCDTLLLIKNTTLSFNTHFQQSLVFVYMTKVKIDQVKVISNIGTLDHCYNSAIFTAQESYLEFNGYNNFFNNTVSVAIHVFSAHLQEESVLNFSFNTFSYVIYVILTLPNIYHSNALNTCPIQYINKKGNLDKEFLRGDKLNYSVIIYDNDMIAVSNTDVMHCSWDSHSAFLVTRSALVNKKFISYNDIYKHDHICLCYKNKTKNCHNEDVGPSYPGQTIVFNFILDDTDTNGTQEALVTTVDQLDITCKHINDESVEFELDNYECKRIEYNVKYNFKGWCEISLQIKYLLYNFDVVETYTILQQPCPKGFSLHLEEYCECDPILSSYIPSLTHCNIDDQTIPRPANSWISTHTVNNSHSYHVSLHCPFDYCLPHSSHLNLSTPDSQCQFHRSGLLCGQCQQGLSAVFGSSQCKHCSNVYLLLLIPIGIAGLVLVLILFVLNLTVTDGNINSFLLSVNIMSINFSFIFPTSNNPVMHTFISLANLDLGIEICFYDGMDEYVKRWLQLAFPAYLIFIAMVIIITSRYSIRIQRLTASRALPVLATLFLLSYTKVLLTVSNVLFSYSTITELPSNQIATVWSVETSVPLFGLKFTILFITCLLLFIVLIPFNVVLTFTRTLSYFRVVTYFKPLLDAYQGPYKIKFYYWTGLQLVIRAIFFGLSALDRDINVMISVMLLGVLLCLNKVFPFKKKINNVMEMLSLLNLQAIFVIAYFMNTNDMMINAIVSLVMFQLICIILLHMKVLFCNDVKFTELSVPKFCKWFPWFGKKERQRRPIELVSTVPEIMYNYKEFREPLIGQD